jgi:NAD(P) transhydrogenase subunit beta
VDPAVRAAVVKLAYLLSATLFILAFKLMARPKTAVRGNLLGAAGMAVAVGAVLCEEELHLSIASLSWVALAVAIGSAVGATLAVRVKMTAMPQMVGLLNGFGGAASLLVAGAELHSSGTVPMGAWSQFIVATGISGVIGSVTFWGSLVAWAKLEEVLFARPVHFRGQQWLNAGLGVLCAFFLGWLCGEPQHAWLFWAIVGVAGLLGVLLTIPIGGADMPVVICLLNSYSGLAAAATGFVIDNYALVISGSLVGASGIILCQIMCKAMNRSLVNVLFGVLGPSVGGPSADDVYAGKVKSASPEELALVFEHARRVVIVPGYGMAVAQAQHAVRDLARLLESRGARVEFAIHPVAGRMPGHMNILLAEADIEYDKMKEMDVINPHFPEVDVAVVIGANDVVNPVARTDPKSPIAGMPILDVDKARTIVVVKRSLSPGFAGIPNPLFAAPNTLMYFADGKQAVIDLAAAIRAA